MFCLCTETVPVASLTYYYTLNNIFFSKYCRSRNYYFMAEVLKLLTDNLYCSEKKTQHHNCIIYILLNQNKGCKLMGSNGIFIPIHVYFQSNRCLPLDAVLFSFHL